MMKKMVIYISVSSQASVSYPTHHQPGQPPLTFFPLARAALLASSTGRLMDFQEATTGAPAADHHPLSTTSSLMMS
jgi:hypothetical protein